MELAKIKQCNEKFHNKNKHLILIYNNYWRKLEIRKGGRGEDTGHKEGILIKLISSQLVQYKQIFDFVAFPRIERGD